MKKLFKSAFTGLLWPACTLQVFVNLSVHVFSWPPTAGWLWWQIYTPLLALLCLFLLYVLTWLFTAIWFSFFLSRREYNIKMDRHNLVMARIALQRLADPTTKEASELRRKIFRIEYRMEKRAKAQSNLS